MRSSIFILFMLCFQFYLSGQSRAELEEKKKNTKKDIELTNELLSKTEKEREASIQQVNLIIRGIQSRTLVIQSIEGEIRLLDYAILRTQNEISELENNVEKEKEEYTRLIYSAYVSQTGEDRFMYILASENLGQAYQRIKYLKYLSEYRKNRVDEIKISIRELESKKIELVEQKGEMEDLLSEKSTENEKLKREKTAKDRMVLALKSKESQLREEIRKKERIQVQLESEIRKIIEEEARKSSSSNIYSSLTPEQKLVGGEFKNNRGKLPWPVERGVITSGYGKIKHPVLNDVWISNSGVDISTLKGSVARSLYDGEVSRVVAILGANYTVIIRHGEYLTVYQNLVNVRVKAGDHVKTKQVLGDVYSDGENSLLHLEIWREKTILNPEEWISK